ncbi:type I restriction enzyme HsdR N-terminal domain-containing protein [bacterium]|nr:type I restriction enzyme HsdR N-terminal domain-containing protein [bacterium]
MAQQQPFLYQGQPFEAPLTVEDGTMKCVIYNYYRPATPEELVRQEVLHFLAELRDSSHITIEVEKTFGNGRRSDIVVSIAYPDKNFKPYIPPILIVETKCADHRLTSADQEQLRDYLKRSQCEWGLLTNQGTSYLCQRNGKCTPCNDLAEVETLVREQSNVFLKQVEQHRAAFAKAHDVGSFESFRQLATEYGRDTRTKFQFTLRDDMGSWTADNFRFDDVAGTCDFRPEGTIRMESRRTFFYRDFERLWRITF